MAAIPGTEEYKYLENLIRIFVKENQSGKESIQQEFKVEVFERSYLKEDNSSKEGID